MPTDPFVPERLDTTPRQEPNLPPGVKMPPPRSWVPNRPGDLPRGQPRGELLGSPGPDIGYALTLANRVRDSLTLAPHEHPQDVLALVSELAMKRAASFGRAPVMQDVDVALQILGYRNKADPDFVEWCVRVVRGVTHNYFQRRELVDAVPIDILRLAPQVVGAHVAEARAALRRAVPEPLVD